MVNKEPPTDLPFIMDAHAHLGFFRNFHIPRSDATGLIATMNASGVDAIVLSAHAAISSDFRRGNDESLAAAARYPNRILVYCVVNPNYPREADEELARCFESPAVRGIKLHPELHGDYPLDGPGYRPAWEYANAHGLPVLSHTYFAGDTLDTFARIASTYPNATVIVGHAGLDHGLEPVVDLTLSYPNIVLDLCGTLIREGVVETLVESVGADRLMLGTDIPFNNGLAQIGTLLYAGITKDDLALIAGGNAKKLFGLPQEAKAQ